MDRYITSLMLSAALSAHAQQAFQDSLGVLAERVAAEIVSNGHGTVALLPITQADGTRDVLGDHLGAELMYHLLAADQGLVWVVRNEMDLLLEEHRLLASGLVRDGGTVPLGEFKEAGVLLTGTVIRTGGAKVRLELRALATGKGVVEGIWRMELPLPLTWEQAERVLKEAQRAAARQAERDAQAAASEERSRGWQLHLAAVGGDHFGILRGGAGLELRHSARVSMGVRAQWMPLSVALPHQVEFGRFTLDDGAYWPDLRMDGVPMAMPGEVHLVAAGDAGFGQELLERAMDRGMRAATWSQVRAVEAGAQRFSLMLPLRLHLGPRRHYAWRPYVEMGYGLDVITMQNRYVGTVTQVVREGHDGYAVNTVPVNVSGVAFQGAREGFRAWNMLLGAGVQVGRFTLGMEWRHAFHARMHDTGGGRKVDGDPVGVALLSGARLESGHVLADLATNGSIRIGHIDELSPPEQPARMHHFLDRSHLQVSVAFRF